MDNTPLPTTSTRLDTNTQKRCFKRTFEFMQHEADNGELYAQVMVADYLYNSGTTSKKDTQRVADLYEKASDAGDVISTHNLAVMHWNGTGSVIQQDKKRAIRLFMRAGDQGHNVSFYKVGIALECGFDDVKAQPEASVHFYTLAALRGHAESQYRMGLLYMKGKGVLADIDRAKWVLRMATEQGHKKAGEELQMIESEMNMRHLKKKGCTQRPLHCRVMQNSAKSSAFRNILPEIETVEDEGANDDDDTNDTNDTNGGVKDDCKPPTSYALEILAETATANDAGENASLW